MSVTPATCFCLLILMHSPFPFSEGNPSSDASSGSRYQASSSESVFIFHLKLNFDTNVFCMCIFHGVCVANGAFCRRFCQDYYDDKLAASSVWKLIFTRAAAAAARRRRSARRRLRTARIGRPRFARSAQSLLELDARRRTQRRTLLRWYVALSSSLLHGLGLVNLNST